MLLYPDSIDVVNTVDICYKSSREPPIGKYHYKIMWDEFVIEPPSPPCHDHHHPHRIWRPLLTAPPSSSHHYGAKVVYDIDTASAYNFMDAAKAADDPIRYAANAANAEILHAVDPHSAGALFTQILLISFMLEWNQIDRNKGRCQSFSRNNARNAQPNVRARASLGTTSSQLNHKTNLHGSVRAQ